MKTTANFLKHLTIACAVILGLGAMTDSTAQQTVARNPANPYQLSRFNHVHRVLLYNYTLGGHNKTYLVNSMTRLANKYGFQLDVGTTQTYITPTTLNGVDVAVFCNGDGDVLQNATSLAATKVFIQDSGKGLLNSHAAAAYVPCPTSGAENLTDANCRWLARVMVRQYLAHDPDPHMARLYVDSVQAGEYPPNTGAISASHVLSTISHGKRNPELQGIFKNLPTNNGVMNGTVNAGVWDSIGDEWYNYRGYVRNQGAQTFDGYAFGPVLVIMSMDESVYYWTTGVAKMGDRVQVWGRHVGNGLTVYQDMGHGDVYVRTRKVGGVTVNDSVAEKINWNLIRYLARDYKGCTDNTNSEYNPEATVSVLTPGFDLANPCTGTTVNVMLTKGKNYNGISLSNKGIRVATPEAGTYQIMIADLNGKRWAQNSAVGGLGKTFETPRLNKGIYFVRVESPKSGTITARVNLN